MIHLILICTFYFAFFAVKIDKLESYHFDLYRNDFKKTYTKEEELFRKNIFDTNLKSIINHNQDPTKTWKEGVNQFTDRTLDELKAYLGKKITPSTLKNIKPLTRDKHNIRRSRNKNNMAGNIDWRDYGIITPVKNQGRCGSCYSFSAAQSVESYHALATGHLEILSEQQILDCTPNVHHCGGTGGCGGGTEELSFAQIIKMGGLSSEWTYPYVSYYGDDSTCNHTRFNPVAKISNFVNLPLNDYESMTYHVATHGPLSVSVDASNWFRYASGIYNGCNQTTPDLDHAVQLVGMGNTTNDGEFWIVKNSWGTTWGENGYIRLYKSSNVMCGTDITPQDNSACEGDNTPITVCGTCGILYSGVYPVV